MPARRQSSSDTPISIGSGWSVTPKAARTPSLISPGERDQIGGAAAAVGQRQGVFAGQRDPSAGALVALGETRALDQPGSGQLHRVRADRPGRTGSARWGRAWRWMCSSTALLPCGSRMGLVKNEPAL